MDRDRIRKNVENAHASLADGLLNLSKYNRALILIELDMLTLLLSIDERLERLEEPVAEARRVAEAEHADRMRRTG